MSKPKIKEYKDEAGEWRISQIASNGEITDSTTEGYKNCQDAVQNRINASIAYLEFYQNQLNNNQIERIRDICFIWN
jgi:uncharacterized protein YegP (UPF0339 family)